MTVSVVTVATVATSRKDTSPAKAITAFKITGHSTGYHDVFRGIDNVEEDSQINRLGELRQMQRISGRCGEEGSHRDSVNGNGGWWAGGWVGGWLGQVGELQCTTGACTDLVMRPK